MTRHNHRTCGFGTGGDYMPLVRYFNFESLECITVEEAEEVNIQVEENEIEVECIMIEETEEVNIQVEENEIEVKEVNIQVEEDEIEVKED